MISLKEVNKKIGLKSGMCLVLISQTDTEYKYILFQHGKGPLCYIDYNNKWNWSNLRINSEYEYKRIMVYNSPTISTMFHEHDLIYDSDWDNVVELTLEEIANKLGINPRKLRIKNL